jgi:hypothetical protein
MEFIDCEVNNFHGLNGFFGKIIAPQKWIKTQCYFSKKTIRRNALNTFQLFINRFFVNFKSSFSTKFMFNYRKQIINSEICNPSFDIF